MSQDFSFKGVQPHEKDKRSSSDEAYILPSWHDYKHQIFKLP